MRPESEYDSGKVRAALGGAVDAQGVPGDRAAHCRPAVLNGLRLLGRLPSAVLIAVVRGYQVLLGPLLGGRCRFHPSCSQYFIQAVQKYGALRGSLKGLWRLARCHPFHPGGYDPP